MGQSLVENLPPIRALLPILFLNFAHLNGLGIEHNKHTGKGHGGEHTNNEVDAVGEDSVPIIRDPTVTENNTSTEIFFSIDYLMTLVLALHSALHSLGKVMLLKAASLFTHGSAPVSSTSEAEPQPSFVMFGRSPFRFRSFLTGFGLH